MHLTSADKRAARDGFQFLVVAGGKRKCYCTTHAEAKSEAGRKGKIVSLGSLRYAARNPSIPAPYAKSWPSSRYGVQVRNPALKTIEVASEDKRGKPITETVPYFETAGPFVRTRSITSSLGETLETVKDDEFARDITHVPTGMKIYTAPIGYSRGPSPKKQAQQAMKYLRAWLKSLSPEQRKLVEEGYTFGERKWSLTQDDLLRDGAMACRGVRRNPDWSRIGSAAAKGAHVAAKYALPAAKAAGQMALIGLKSLGSGLASFAKGFAARHQEELPHTAEEVRQQIEENDEEIDKAKKLMKEQERKETADNAEVEALRKAKDALEREQAALKAMLPAMPQQPYGYPTMPPQPYGYAPPPMPYGYAPPPMPYRNPRGLTPAGKRHLIQTMHKAGADTFRKKVAYVRRHMPNVTDPQAFVGYVMKGERKGR